MIKLKFLKKYQKTKKKYLNNEFINKFFKYKK